MVNFCRGQGHWSWKSETFLVCRTDRQTAPRKRDRHGTALLSPPLGVQPRRVFIDSAGAHRLLTEFLRLWSWVLLQGLSASVWLWTLAGVCQRKAEGTPPKVTLVRELHDAEKHWHRNECPLYSIPSSLSQRPLLSSPAIPCRPAACSMSRALPKASWPGTNNRVPLPRGIHTARAAAPGLWSFPESWLQPSRKKSREFWNTRIWFLVMILFRSTFRKLRSWHLVPSLHGK